jgi:hypothetical protein
MITKAGDEKQAFLGIFPPNDVNKCQFLLYIRVGKRYTIAVAEL